MTIDDIDMNSTAWLQLAGLLYELKLVEDMR